MNKRVRKIVLISIPLLIMGVLLVFVLLASNVQKSNLLNIRVGTPKTLQNTYSSSLRYKISYPEGYVIEPNGYYSILIFKLSDQPGAGPMNFIYVSVVQPNQLENEGEIYNYNPGQFKKLQSLKIGESVSLADSLQPIFDQYMTYTRVDDAVIDGHTAKRFENNGPWEMPEGTTEVRYMFEDNKYKYEQGPIIYILGYYYGGKGVADPIDASEASEVVSSFELN